MISLQMPSSAEGLIRKQKRIISDEITVNNIAILESKSRPDLSKYGYKASLYEEKDADKKSELSFTPKDGGHGLDLMCASTASQEHYCKYLLNKSYLSLLHSPI